MEHSDLRFSRFKDSPGGLRRVGGFLGERKVLARNGRKIIRKGMGVHGGALPCQRDG